MTSGSLLFIQIDHSEHWQWFPVWACPPGLCFGAPRPNFPLCSKENHLPAAINLPPPPIFSEVSLSTSHRGIPKVLWVEKIPTNSSSPTPGHDEASGMDPIAKGPDLAWRFPIAPAGLPPTPQARDWGRHDFVKSHSPGPGDPNRRFNKNAATQSNIWVSVNPSEKRICHGSFPRGIAIRNRPGSWESSSPV